MITDLFIRNFKSIDRLEFSCKNLNIITGVNSSGKSTFIQALMLLAQNSYGNIGLNGSLVSIGDFIDAKNYNSGEREIEIVLCDRANNNLGLMITEDGITNDFLDDRFGSYSPPESFVNVQYLSCSRIGAEDTYKKNYDYNSRTVGVNGEYAVFCLNQFGDEPLEEKLIIDDGSYTLLHQVNYWLDYILGYTVATENIVGTDLVKGFFVTPDRKQIRPRNTGAGLSYLLSIIVMCLMSRDGDILVIENPEIHLHPRAQSRVCRFLYFVAASGRQLFVETHSDHVFNGVRAGIATETMDPDLISMNFFTINENNCTENNVIQFGNRGRILNYKPGLFDQFDIDLNIMLGL